jgi:acetyl esterase/lipase
LLSCAIAQEKPSRGGAGDKSLLQRFDTNGDGQIDDSERRAVREKMKQMQNKPGAMTPSGKSESVGNRIITEMQYPSSDGKMIPCVLSIPQGSGPFPMLVTIHGGQGNRDLGYIRTMAAPNGLSPTITAVNEQPWAILAISYRAGNGALFGMEQDDVVAGIRFAKSLPKIDPHRVGVVGGSHGGHLALVAAEKMGREFLCVAVGSPWMTDPVVYMTGDPTKPPLSNVPEKPREELQLNGRRILNGMKMGRRMSDDEIRKFISEHSIEANADKIAIPTLFLTSRGDDQAPHALIEPMIQRMRAAKKEVQVYTAEKSPHGFYWARTVSAARDLRGEKTPQEAEEELTARRTMIEFFTTQFARKDTKAEPSPDNQPTADPPSPGEDVAESNEMPLEEPKEKNTRRARGGASRPSRGTSGMPPNRQLAPDGADTTKTSPSRGGSCLSRRSLCSGSCRRAPLASPQFPASMEWRTTSNSVRRHRLARRDIHPAQFSKRGLPLPQYLDSEQRDGRFEIARFVLDTWRCIHPRLRCTTPIRWYRISKTGRRCDFDQLPARSSRTFCAPSIDR